MAEVSSSTRWRELDVLRTLAVVLMILNHSMVRGEPGSATPGIEACAFVGSMAPVAFFFLTGLGSGIQAAGKVPSLGLHQWVKVGILIAADAFLWLTPGRFLGMDFLGFIAASAILVKLLAQVPRSGRIAAIGALLVVVARFGAGAVLRARLPDSGLGRAAAFLLGVESLDGFSYPPGPWLAYPLSGYALGRFLARRRPILDSRRRGVAWLLVLAGVAFGALATAMAARGAPMFRWGTMSIGFFAASLSALAFLLAAATMAGARPWARTIGIAAVASFAAVPLHFLALAAFEAAFGRPVGAAAHAIDFLIAAAVALAGGSLMDRFGSTLRRMGPSVNAFCWAEVACAAVAAAAYLASTSPPPLASAAIRSSAQLGLCLLLGLPVPSRGRGSSEAA